MRQQILLNNNWFFKPGFNIKDVKTFNASEFESVILPHTVEELPLNYFDERCYQQLYTYQLILDDALLNNIEKDQRAFLVFEGVMTYARVYVNGVVVAEHKGGYTPFEVPLTGRLNETDNRITVEVDCRERDDIPPFGGQIDYLTYGGIYREVYLLITDDVSIERIKIETPTALAEDKQVVVDCYLRNPPAVGTTVSYHVQISTAGGDLIKEQTVDLPVTDSPAQISFSRLSNLSLWSVDDPCLYQVTVSTRVEGATDSYTQRFGFRTTEFTPDGFLLNGKPLKLVGVNRHQSMAYLGYAFGERRQRWDADNAKFELGFNLIRCSHYPQHKAFLDRCDEIGLLVFEEVPGWQHMGGQAWQDQVVTDVKDMIQRDWNHPSIVIWGVRINESQDNHALYSKTNALAHKLDPTRQTGGVRYHTDSELLEDVYTMNDFALNGGPVALRDQQTVTGLDHKVPYLVTEYNGHMFPTKRFDPEEHQQEHVNRHLRVLDAMYADPNISGCITWCMFDYNTHKDFGSGDRVCYHGITDIHRIPKYAASVYASQLSPERKIVLEPVSVWARGERAECLVMPFMILTNCDYIEFEFGEYGVQKIFPDTERFSHLPHPPIVIDQRHISNDDLEMWGMRWLGASIRGFVNGEQVIERGLLADATPARIEVSIDDEQLRSDVKDLTRVVIRGVDAQGNLLLFWNPVINLELTGVGRIVGPKQMALQGGVAATWLETDLQKGEMSLSVQCDGFDNQNITVTVV